MTPERGQIVWVNFNPQKGHEQAGRRPALVISPSVYNAVSNCVILCPITSNTDPWPWKVMLPKGGDIAGAVLVDQIKSIDAKARNIEDSGQGIEADVMDEVLARLATLTG
jgi:mRNA interferase MazF